MEYHKQRYKDHSLLVFRNESLVAICPAHRVDNVLKSHWGLTYGGFVWGHQFSEEMVLAVYEASKQFLLKQGITKLEVKEIPAFYLDQEANAWNRTLFKYAQAFHTEKVFAIDYDRPLTIHKTKLKHYRKGKKLGFEIAETPDFSQFWNTVLIPRLSSRHSVKPVHSLEEISLLASRFPDEIKQFTISLNGELLAGITLFDKGEVVKSQYGATTERGQKLRALEFLFLYLIYFYQQQGKSFFSMGTIGDDRFPDGFNPGLKKQKEELGCTEFHQHFYTFEL